MTDPTYTLPDLPALDARSAIALAVHAELDRQLAGQDVALVVDPGPIANAALAALGDERDWPRIPAWDGTPRSIGGGRPADSAHPDPLITVEPEPDDRGTPRTGHVALNVEMAVEDHDVRDRIVMPVEDVEMWALAVLAACRAART